MTDPLSANLDTLLVYLFAACALIGAVLMLVLRQPMRVALALISTMVFLGGIYGLLGVHFIAAFQVLIYVGAVMVFMVYVIMLLDPREAEVRGRFSRLLLPGFAAAAVFFGTLVYTVSSDPPTATQAATAGSTAFTLRQFSVAFLDEYWLHFELTSVLLLAAVVAAIAVIQIHRRKRG